MYPYPGVDGETRSDAEIARQRAEEVTRKATDLEWLREGFAYAASVGAKGVMIIWQADPNFNNDQHLEDTREWDAFPDYVNALQANTLAFSGQVALVHGDGHYFKIDKPINRPNGGVLANFTRVETFDARNTHWVQRPHRSDRSEPVRIRTADRPSKRAVERSAVTTGACSSVPAPARFGAK